jgi:hypothetical protein
MVGVSSRGMSARSPTRESMTDVRGVCRECGAAYTEEGDSCAARFAVLLGLDHSRQEPWGSRHGQAFAAFALQHPSTYAASLDHAWAALYRIYAANDDPRHVFSALRAAGGRLPREWVVPSRSVVWMRPPTMTIIDMGNFAADTYADQLDVWCRATLAAFGLGSGQTP